VSRDMFAERGGIQRRMVAVLFQKKIGGAPDVELGYYLAGVTRAWGGVGDVCAPRGRLCHHIALAVA